MTHLGFFCLTLTLACARLAGVAQAAQFAFLLKRYSGLVTGLCLDGPSHPVDIGTATAFLIGRFPSIAGSGRLCVNKPPAVYANSVSDPAAPFIRQPWLPLTVASSSFVAPVWTAGPGDLVNFTAVNALPQRALSVDGTPVPIELLPPTNSTPSVQSLQLQPATSFNITAVDMLPTAQAYMAWCLKGNNGRDPQGAVLIETDSSDPDGITWDVGYLIFRRERDGTISGILFVASYYQPAPTAARRRLLSLQKLSKETSYGPHVRKRTAARRLLSYYYYGGSDTSGSRTCSFSCNLISPTPPGCNPSSASYPACRYSCRCR